MKHFLTWTDVLPSPASSLRHYRITVHKQHSCYNNILCKWCAQLSKHIPHNIFHLFISGSVTKWNDWKGISSTVCSENKDDRWTKTILSLPLNLENYPNIKNSYIPLKRMSEENNTSNLILILRLSYTHRLYVLPKRKAKKKLIT